MFTYMGRIHVCRFLSRETFTTYRYIFIDIHVMCIVYYMRIQLTRRRKHVPTSNEGHQSIAIIDNLTRVYSSDSARDILIVM